LWQFAERGDKLPKVIVAGAGDQYEYFDIALHILTFTMQKMNTNTKKYRPTQQERSTKSETRILEAAQDLFSKKGFERTRTSDIILQAGCSNGAFFYRFGSKRKVFDVMLTRYVAFRKQTLMTADFSRSVHGNVGALLEYHATNSITSMRTSHGMYRAAQEISVIDKEVWQELTDLAVLSGERIKLVAREYAEEIKAENPEEALQYALQTVIMISLQTTLGAGPLFPKDLDKLRKVIVKAALGTLV